MKKTEIVQPPKLDWRHFLGIFFLLIFTSLAWVYIRNPEAGNMTSGFTKNALDVLSSSDNRTNVVFLGIGGEGHSGADLTDSIILFSYHHSTRSVTLIPIPRDIWVASMKAKINSAYHYGNENNGGTGKELIKRAVAETTGLPVHYAAVLDFAGFEKLIDIVGGIDVIVERSFDDYKYPVPGKETAEPESNRYEHLSFVAGPTHLSGSMALKFARSRHALGEEGTDFARSERQEKVILAFKDKLLSSGTLLSPTTLENLVDGVRDSLDTDIGDTESGAFIRLFLTYANNSTSAKSINLVDHFYNPRNLSPYAGQWVLIPKTKIEDVYAYVAQELAK